MMMSGREPDVLVASLKRTVLGFRDFSGRSRRADVVCYWIVASAASLILSVNLSKILPWQAAVLVHLVVYTAAAVPAFALLVRRLHDQDRSGQWALLFPVMYICKMVQWLWSIADQPLFHVPTGMPTVPMMALELPLQIAILIVALLPGTSGPNRFGPNPRPKAVVDMC